MYIFFNEVTIIRAKKLKNDTLRFCTFYSYSWRRFVSISGFDDREMLYRNRFNIFRTHTPINWVGAVFAFLLIDCVTLFIIEKTQCLGFQLTCMNQRNIATLICFCVFGTLIFGIIGISVLVIVKQNISWNETQIKQVQ